jgi:serine/threonine protein kinase
VSYRDGRLCVAHNHLKGAAIKSTEGSTSFDGPTGVSPIAPTMVAALEARRLPFAGADLAGYRLVRQIRRGATGTIYDAVELREHRRVAVKIVRGAGQGGQAAVDHPGVVEVLESGRADGGALFLVMEYLEGQTLAERLLAHGPLTAIEIIRIGIQIADALATAHRAGVIHRDLRPEKIFLHQGAAQTVGRVKLLGLGLAGLRQDRGGRPGAARYRAPEQALAAGPVKARADIYALGCILYEMATGRVPFVDRDAEDDSARRLCAPLPPSCFACAVPAGLDAVVLQMLPADRPATMEEVADSLARINPADRPRVVTSISGARTSPLPLHRHHSRATRGRRAMVPPRALVPIAEPFAQDGQPPLARRWLLALGLLVSLAVLTLLAI